MKDFNKEIAENRYIDLASERLGGKVPYANDDFFAAKENLIKSGRGIFVVDKYTDRGKWMDGWESRRRRTPGHDWCILQLGIPGKIKILDIDTNHFLGNHPPFASVDALYLAENPSVAEIVSGKMNWVEILPKSPLAPGSQNFFEVPSDEIWTHLRLNIFPDGGLARFKVYGSVFKDWSKVRKDELIDLAAAVNGGKALVCNDMFFSHMTNLIMPGKGRNMGDGWETKRNRNPNNCDWVILQLGTRGVVKKIIVDTLHFKGNYPDTCSIEACCQAAGKAFDPEKVSWKILLPKVKLEADTEHIYEHEIALEEPVTHVKLNIYPDGGVSRLRLFGTIDRT